MKILIKSTSTLLPLPSHSPPPDPLPFAEEPAIAIVYIVLDQGQILGLVAVIISGDVDARTPFQRCEKGGGHAVADPLDYSVDPPAAR